jgi:hypothetical protein
MQRYCVRCREEISALRLARGAYFCSDECRRLDKMQRRRAKAGKSCRLCGRPFATQEPVSDTTAGPAVEIQTCATVAQTD